MSEVTAAPPEAAPNGPRDGQPLGISGRIARAFINTPVTPMLLMACMGLGLIGLLFTPRQEDPQISVPMIDLFVQYPGASAGQVESLVTEPLERIMKEIPGVRHVYSATQRGAAMVTVRFHVGEEMGASIVKVHDKLQSNMDKVPPDVRMPLVKPVSVDDVPVVTLTLWSDEVPDSQLRTLALDVLQRLGSVPDTGKGFVVGGREDQIRVEVLMERLAGHGVTLDRIAQTIRTANSELTTGASESGGSAYNVYSGSFLRTAEDIARLVVGTQGGRPVYIGDVARVAHVPEDTRQMVTHSTGPGYAGDHPAESAQAVTLAIAKKEKTNGVTVSRAILAKVETLKGELIPDNVRVEITRNYGKTANDKVNELLRAMFEAALIVSFLCLVGLGARAAFVVITVIPVVIVLTIWWAMMVDYTIDRVSLFALIFSIGILVDDATVVVENIFRHWLEKGETTIAEAVRAVDEVGNPTILATLTIISALLPMGWVSGLMGPYMRPIPVLGASAMAFSLFAAFVFTPWFTLRMRPRLAALEKAERREARTRAIVSRLYRPLIEPLIANRFLGKLFLTGIIAATAAVCVLFYTQTVPVKMLPFDNKPEFSVVVNLPEGTALPVTANVLHQLSLEVRKIPEVTAVQTYAGTAQPFNFNGMVRHYYLRRNPWEGDLLVMLTDKKARERGSHAIASEARRLLTPLAASLGARIAVVEMPPGPPVLQTVVAEVYGPDAETRRQVARDLTGIFESVPNVVDADNYLSEPFDAWRFEVDAEKAVRRGVSVDAVNQNLAMAMGGFRLGDVKRGNVQEPTYIVLQVPLAYRAQPSSLASLPIATPDGGVVPLAELGRFVRQPEDPILYHKDLRPMEYVIGEMEGFLGAPIYGMLAVEDRLASYTAPDGVRISGMPGGLIGPPADDAVSGFEWTGEWTVTYETFRDMGLAFMAALLLIYGLIVWQFRDLALSGLIMAPIPLTLVGIIPGHWIMGAEFTATSMIGLIALGGIIVRQSILIVEFVKIEVARGLSVTEAALAGAEIRMRPILITSLTTIGGAWALMFDPIFQGMAVSIFFGAAVGTLMAVLVIPLGCITLRRRFYLEESPSGEIVLSPEYGVREGGGGSAVPESVAGLSGVAPGAVDAPSAAPHLARRTSLLARALLVVWGALVSLLFWLFERAGGLIRLIRARGGRQGDGEGRRPRTPVPGGGGPAGNGGAEGPRGAGGPGRGVGGAAESAPAGAVSVAREAPISATPEALISATTEAPISATPKAPQLRLPSFAYWSTDDPEAIRSASSDRAANRAESEAPGSPATAKPSRRNGAGTRKASETKPPARKTATKKAATARRGSVPTTAKARKVTPAARPARKPASGRSDSGSTPGKPSGSDHG